MKNKSKLKDHSLVPDFNPANSLGLQERELKMQITGPQERLAYPTRKMAMSNACEVLVYLIPDEDKQKVLDALYPFNDTPSLDDERIDLHTGRSFKVRDYIVTREGNGNFLVTPYYAEKGGTVLDWMRPDDIEGQCKRGLIVSSGGVRG